uniref:Uncharacterized protein n=1 Tax=Anguilla anguilla TaxID=7936 RepID=A0A0E9UCQ7_ANGAN
MNSLQNSLIDSHLHDANVICMLMIWCVNKEGPWIWNGLSLQRLIY